MFQKKLTIIDKKYILLLTSYGLFALLFRAIHLEILHLYLFSILGCFLISSFIIYTYTKENTARKSLRLILNSFALLIGIIGAVYLSITSVSI